MPRAIGQTDTMLLLRGLLVVAVLGSIGACVGPEVKVTTLSPSPRAMAPRAVEAVEVLTAAPTKETVDVYRIDASGGGEGDLMTALRSKAASLGCDAIVVQDTKTPERVQKEQVTGQLIDHRDTTAAHVSALCVMYAATAAPAGA